MTKGFSTGYAVIHILQRIFGLVILFFLFFFAASFRSVQATAPVRYYDWSATTEIASQVLGVATPSASAKDFLQFDRYLVGGNLTPDNIFYFVKGVQEGIQLTLTFNAKAKEEMRLELAGERLKEMQIMADKAKVEAVKTAAQNYQRAMEDATDNLINNASPEMETEIAKHQVVLGEVTAQVPDAAEDAVKKALQASENGSDALADLSGRPAIPPDLVDRISALKAQGLLTQEEATKLISFKTRVEAREELRKYADSGILPPADLLRLNEQMKSSFPQEFYKIHELERFQEIKKLESQQIDQGVQERVQEFAKTYIPGEIIPQDIRPYWGPLVRLEEVQNTFRPDLIDPSLFKNNPDNEKKFKEIVERYKPRQEDINFVNQYINNNKATVDELPPEYQRMYNLFQTYGVQTAQPQTKEVSCPSNAHYASGYCIPNYTPRGEGSYCPGGYHRNYESGPCLQDNNTSGYLPPLTTTPGNYPNPYIPNNRCLSGQHWVPEPIDPNGGYCTSDNYQPPTTSNFYPQNPSMGNCRTPGECYDWCKSNPGKCGGFDPNSPRPENTNAATSPSSESQEAACRAGGGTCVSWVNGACGCVRPSDVNSGCRLPSSGCGSGRWWDQGACVCRENGSYPSSCAYPSAGCGSGNYWDSGSCQCRPTSTTNSGSNMSRESQEATCRSGGGTCNWGGDICQCQGYNSSANYTPPSGYGSCSSGQYWNGSTCVSNTSGPSTESQENACRNGGCQWQDGACRCGTQTPESNSAPQNTPPPADQPPPPSSPPPAPSSSPSL